VHSPERGDKRFFHIAYLLFGSLARLKHLAQPDDFGTERRLFLFLSGEQSAVVDQRFFDRFDRTPACAARAGEIHRRSAPPVPFAHRKKNDNHERQQRRRHDQHASSDQIGKHEGARLGAYTETVKRAAPRSWRADLPFIFSDI